MILAPPPLLALPFPAIDPVLFAVGPFAIRWYALAYIAGFLIGWWLAKRLVAEARLWSGGASPFAPSLIDDAILWAALAGILGGRLGFVLVYNFDHYIRNPAEILMVWQGGMAFHGGVLGAIVGLWLFARRNSIPFLSLLDVAAVVTPIGILLGRIANFINGELWGRVSDAPWAFVFPRAGDLPRHPSQLYQAAAEGLLLFVVLLLVARGGGLRKPGAMAGLFGMGYALTRSFGEFFREPDSQLGFLLGGATMGQWLSLPLFVAGLILFVRARRAA